MPDLRSKLEELLCRSNGHSLQAEFNEPWLNDLIPGMNLLADCDQGTAAHLEGNVAIHTGLVFDNLLTVCQQRLNRSPDFIERLSVLLHDCRKPQTRAPQSGGKVSFPGHEELAACEVPRLAEVLKLSEEEAGRLHFLVARHGDAHTWKDLSASVRAELLVSPWIISLALIQEADARSCILGDGSHLPVFWEELTESR